jgi:glycogen phosphorylase
MTALPSRIAGLADIAHNLRWSWRREARALFREIDRALWEETRHNPVELLRQADPARLTALAADPEFLRDYDTLMALDAAEAAQVDTWYATTHPDLVRRPIAYFCAEFGLHRSVPVYSGGLGILAGDHCKAASDLGVPLVGVGLMYLHGYFDQRLRPDGWQEDGDEVLDLSATPLEAVPGPGGEPFVDVVEASGRTIHVGVWRLLVGRVSVYLLDTDIPANHPDDRELTSRLYGGDSDMRLRQEWILGVGGVRVLRALGIAPAVWHANEGHAAFMLVERVGELVRGGTPLDQAIARVRAASVFTTHTPVPAGHDVFSTEQLERCVGPVWLQMGMEQDAFFKLGAKPESGDGGFHMTFAALRLSGRVNGVSRIHGEVSRRLWASVWPGREVARVPIGHITNGVHRPTWMAPSIAALLDRQVGLDWVARADDPGFWAQLTLEDDELWAVHRYLKALLVSFVREEARRRFARRWTDAVQVVGAGTLLDPDTLTIGFARRFATYKRAGLPFRDAERLRALLTNPRRPVQIIFAGKAHPADTPGKEVLQAVYRFTRDSQFQGRVAFLEDYEMHVARRLVEGVDLWFNLPRLPLEASGTSGMKAALNGVPQLGTRDGWWAEGYDGTNGWEIPPALPGTDADASDAEHLYRLLENEVVPMYYARDARGVPVRWVEKMQGAMRVAGARFTASRMVREYVESCYVPAMRDGNDSGDPPTA